MATIRPEVVERLAQALDEMPDDVDPLDGLHAGVLIEYGCTGATVAEVKAAVAALATYHAAMAEAWDAIVGETDR
jgi:hypothetical protein